MRTLSVLIFILSAVPAAAADTPYTLALSLPDQSAKELGERFTVQLDLHLQKPYRLNAKSLPGKERVGLHLQREEPQVSASWGLWAAHSYQITIPYQVIGHSAERAHVLVPALVLDLQTDEESFPLVVAPFNVEIAPGLALLQREPGEALDLLPQRAPPLLNTPKWLLGALAFAFLLLLQLAGMLWRRWLGPLWWRYQRPFARANRALAKLAPSAQQAVRLRLFHAALNSSAGETVLSCDLGDFLHRCPHFKPLEAQFEQLFRYSDQYYFQAYTTPAPKPQGRFDVGELLRNCARIEALQ